MRGWGQVGLEAVKLLTGKTKCILLEWYLKILPGIVITENGEKSPIYVCICLVYAENGEKSPIYVCICLVYAENCEKSHIYTHIHIHTYTHIYGENTHKYTHFR